MENILNKVLFTILGLCFCAPLLAQPPVPPATPIDGGLSLLLAAGGIYGIKKLSDKKKSEH